MAAAFEAAVGYGGPPPKTLVPRLKLPTSSGQSARAVIAPSHSVDSQDDEEDLEAAPTSASSTGRDSSSKPPDLPVPEIIVPDAPAPSKRGPDIIWEGDSLLKFPFSFAGAPKMRWFQVVSEVGPARPR